MSDTKNPDIKPEDVTATPKAEKATKAATPKAEKATKAATPKADEVADLKADTVGHFEELADQSKKNLSSGGKNVKIDLIETIPTRFTKDIGHIKAGHEQPLSQVAFDIYKKKGAVEKI